MMPVRCVVDTNVLVTANGGNESASAECVAASARALQRVRDVGHVFLDAPGAIVAEYRNNLAPFGQPRPGNAFLKWLLTNEYNPARVTRVALTPVVEDPGGFQELPPPPDGVQYDPSDRKFLAVSAAHPEHPPILQALDSKWWGWTVALKGCGVSIHFLCPDEIAAKHREKLGG
jgi:hypothetical protein